MQKQLEDFSTKLNSIYDSDKDEVTRANDMFSLIINRAIGFNHSKSPNIILDGYVEDNRCILLYKMVEIVGMLTQLNFCVNRATYLEKYTRTHYDSDYNYINMLGDRLYQAKIESPAEDEFVWTDQDVEVGAIDRVIPVFRGVPDEMIDFIVNTLYKGE